jgi:hypothetical protein
MSRASACGVLLATALWRSLAHRPRATPRYARHHGMHDRTSLQRLSARRNILTERRYERDLKLVPLRRKGCGSQAN